MAVGSSTYVAACTARLAELDRAVLLGLMPPAERDLEVRLLALVLARRLDGDLPTVYLAQPRKRKK